MDKNKDYSLYIDGIDDSVSNFVSKDATLKLSVQKPDATKAIYKIAQGKDIGVINVYIKKSGLVSITIQGAKSLNALCEQCCDSFIQQTAIPNSLRKNFKLRRIKIDDVELFKEELVDTHKFTIVARAATANPTIQEWFDVSDSNNCRVTCTLYGNGTFLLQGNVTPLYVTVMTEALRWLVDETKMSSLPDSISLNNTVSLYSEDIKCLIPQLPICGDTDGIIERMVLTSVRLFNSGIIVDDYGCYTFGVLKALEGVLKLRLSDDLGPIDKLGEHFYYDQPSHRHRIISTVYDGKLDLKKAINKGYNNWVSSRHSTFHADDQIATSTLLSYEQAIAVFQDTLNCINAICDNWN